MKEKGMLTGLGDDAAFLHGGFVGHDASSSNSGCNSGSPFVDYHRKFSCAAMGCDRMVPSPAPPVGHSSGPEVLSAVSSQLDFAAAAHSLFELSACAPGSAQPLGCEATGSAAGAAMQHTTAGLPCSAQLMAPSGKAEVCFSGSHSSLDGHVSHAGGLWGDAAAGLHGGVCPPAPGIAHASDPTLSGLLSSPHLLGLLLGRTFAAARQQHAAGIASPILSASTQMPAPATTTKLVADLPRTPAQDASTSMAARPAVAALSHRLQSKRMAQKRYRTRQKEKVGSLEDRVHQIKSQLRQLNLQNRSLQQRQRALTHLITSRDMQLYILNKGKHRLEQQFAGDASSEELMTGGNQVVAAFYDYIDRYEEKGLRSRVSYDYLHTHWKRVMSNITTYLVQLDLDAQNERVQNSLNEDMHSIGTAVRLLLVQDRHALFDMFSFNAVAGKVEHPEPDHWSKVIDRMDLSDQQKEDFKAAREFHKESVDRAHECCTALLACVLDKFDSSARYYTASTLHATDRTVEVECELKLVQRLDETLEQELDICMMLWLVLSNSLTPIQRARMLVHSHPFFPDLFAMVAAV